ncbi:MAG: GNAT family N-acetyltransferase [Flavobacteriaceae bacterium]|nr:GNAT family N-acetyltransferase [Flavobacteriaceae bacterium]
MKTNILQGKTILLRALEPSDIDFLFSVENNEDFWEISDTQQPYSKHILKNYIENAHQDIYEAKQYRFVIQHIEDNCPVGIIDLFDFVPQHQRAGIGIMVLPKYQGVGIGFEALQIIKKYAFHYLKIHQLFAEIECDNANSISVFEKVGFQKTGTKKEWILSDKGFKDVGVYQLILE